MEPKQGMAAKARSVQNCVCAFCFFIAAFILTACLPPVSGANEPDARAGSISLAHGEAGFEPPATDLHGETAPAAHARHDAGAPPFMRRAPLRVSGAIKPEKSPVALARAPPAFPAPQFTS